AVGGPRLPRVFQGSDQLRVALFFVGAKLHGGNAGSNGAAAQQLEDTAAGSSHLAESAIRLAGFALRRLESLTKRLVLANQCRLDDVLGHQAGAPFGPMSSSIRNDCCVDVLASVVNVPPLCLTARSFNTCAPAEGVQKPERSHEIVAL